MTGEASILTTDRERARSLWPPTCHGRWMREEYEPGLASVIVPAYNRAHFLVDAMDSAWAQTHRPVELLVVDDGSTDATAEVLQRWRREHTGDRGFVLRSFRQPNRGAPAARNLGLIESRGEFIQFLDSDDVLGRTKLAAQVAFLRERADSTPPYASWRDFSRRNDRAVDVSRAGPADAAAYTLPGWIRGGFIPPHAILWPRPVAFALGPWDERASLNNDGEYACRFLLGGHRFIWCPESWVYYRRGSGDHLSAGMSAAGAQGRFYVAERIRAALVARGRLDCQTRMAMAAQYWFIARWAAGVDAELAATCFERIRQLGSPHLARTIGGVVGIRGTIFATAVGMKLLRAWRRIRRKGPFSVHRRVQSVGELFDLDQDGR